MIKLQFITVLRKCENTPVYNIYAAANPRKLFNSIIKLNYENNKKYTFYYFDLKNLNLRVDFIKKQNVKRKKY